MQIRRVHDYNPVLSSGRWFCMLPTALQEWILDYGTVQSLAPQQVLFCRGDSFCGIYAVVQGSIRITSVGENGKEAILTFLEPPDWFGEIALIDHQERAHDAIAEETSTVIQLSPRPLQALLEAEPAYWREFALLVTHKVRLAFRSMEDRSLFPTSVRLCRRLVLMAEGYGNWQNRSLKVITLQQEQLGMMLGISRQSVNQMLKELQSRGVIHVSYGEIEILDMARLRHEARLGD